MSTASEVAYGAFGVRCRAMLGQAGEPVAGMQRRRQLRYSSGSVVKRRGYPALRPASVARIALVSAMSRA